MTSTERQSAPPELSAAPLARSPVRWLHLGLGYVCVGLALAGTVLPLLPTTPFLLVAVWAFARASPRLRDRLYGHPRFGRFLRDWERHRAIPRGAKLCAVAGMAASWAVVAAAAQGVAVPASVGLMLLGVAAYVVTRPVPVAEPVGED